MMPPLDRRRALAGMAALAGSALLPPLARAAPLERAVPATGERLPAIGMGTWLTFDVSAGTDRNARLPVLRARAISSRLADAVEQHLNLRLLAEWLPGVDERR